jgi:hypothetical protein
MQLMQLAMMTQIVINTSQRGGTMDLSELSLERALSVSNAVYLVAVGIAAVASVLIYSPKSAGKEVKSAVSIDKHRLFVVSGFTYWVKGQSHQKAL